MEETSQEKVVLPSKAGPRREGSFIIVEEHIETKELTSEREGLNSRDPDDEDSCPLVVTHGTLILRTEGPDQEIFSNNQIKMKLHNSRQNISRADNKLPSESSKLEDKSELKTKPIKHKGKENSISSKGINKNGKGITERKSSKSKDIPKYPNESKETNNKQQKKIKSTYKSSKSKSAKVSVRDSSDENSNQKAGNETELDINISFEESKKSTMLETSIVPNKKNEDNKENTLNLKDFTGKVGLKEHDKHPKDSSDIEKDTNESGKENIDDVKELQIESREGQDLHSEFSTSVMKFQDAIQNFSQAVLHDTFDTMLGIVEPSDQIEDIGDIENVKEWIESPMIEKFCELKGSNSIQMTHTNIKEVVEEPIIQKEAYQVGANHTESSAESCSNDQSLPELDLKNTAVTTDIAADNTIQPLAQKVASKDIQIDTGTKDMVLKDNISCEKEATDEFKEENIEFCSGNNKNFKTTERFAEKFIEELICSIDCDTAKNSTEDNKKDKGDSNAFFESIENKEEVEESVDVKKDMDMRQNSDSVNIFLENESREKPDESHNGENSTTGSIAHKPKDEDVENSGLCLDKKLDLDDTDINQQHHDPDTPVPVTDETIARPHIQTLPNIVISEEAQQVKSNLNTSKKDSGWIEIPIIRGHSESEAMATDKISIHELSDSEMCDEEQPRSPIITEVEEQSRKPKCSVPSKSTIEFVDITNSGQERGISNEKELDDTITSKTTVSLGEITNSGEANKESKMINVVQEIYDNNTSMEVEIRDNSEHETGDNQKKIVAMPNSDMMKEEKSSVEPSTQTVHIAFSRGVEVEYDSTEIMIPLTIEEQKANISDDSTELMIPNESVEESLKYEVVQTDTKNINALDDKEMVYNQHLGDVVSLDKKPSLAEHKDSEESIKEANTRKDIKHMQESIVKEKMADSDVQEKNDDPSRLSMEEEESKLEASIDQSIHIAFSMGIDSTENVVTLCIQEDRVDISDNDANTCIYAKSTNEVPDHNVYKTDISITANAPEDTYDSAESIETLHIQEERADISDNDANTCIYNKSTNEAPDHDVYKTDISIARNAPKDTYDSTENIVTLHIQEERAEISNNDANTCIYAKSLNEIPDHDVYKTDISIVRNTPSCGQLTDSNNTLEPDSRSSKESDVKDDSHTTVSETVDVEEMNYNQPTNSEKREDVENPEPSNLSAQAAFSQDAEAENESSNHIIQLAVEEHKEDRTDKIGDIPAPSESTEYEEIERNIQSIENALKDTEITTKICSTEKVTRKSDIIEQFENIFFSNSKVCEKTISGDEVTYNCNQSESQYHSEESRVYDIFSENISTNLENVESISNLDAESDNTELNNTENEIVDTKLDIQDPLEFHQTIEENSNSSEAQNTSSGSFQEHRDEESISKSLEIGNIIICSFKSESHQPQDMKGLNDSEETLILEKNLDVSERIVEDYSVSDPSILGSEMQTSNQEFELTQSESTGSISSLQTVLEVTKAGNVSSETRQELSNVTNLKESITIEKLSNEELCENIHREVSEIKTTHIHEDKSNFEFEDVKVESKEVFETSTELHDTEICVGSPIEMKPFQTVINDECLDNSRILSSESTCYQKLLEEKSEFIEIQCEESSDCERVHASESIGCQELSEKIDKSPSADFSNMSKEDSNNVQVKDEKNFKIERIQSDSKGINMLEQVELTNERNLKSELISSLPQEVQAEKFEEQNTSTEYDIIAIKKSFTNSPEEETKGVDETEQNIQATERESEEGNLPSWIRIFSSIVIGATLLTYYLAPAYSEEGGDDSGGNDGHTPCALDGYVKLSRMNYEM